MTLLTVEDPEDHLLIKALRIKKRLGCWKNGCWVSM